MEQEHPPRAPHPEKQARCSPRPSWDPRRLRRHEMLACSCPKQALGQRRSCCSLTLPVALLQFVFCLLSFTHRHTATKKTQAVPLVALSTLGDILLADDTVGRDRRSRLSRVSICVDSWEACSREARYHSKGGAGDERNGAMQVSRRGQQQANTQQQYNKRWREESGQRTAAGLDPRTG